MDIKIVLATKLTEEGIAYIADPTERQKVQDVMGKDYSREVADYLSGLMAGTCYSKAGFIKLVNQPIEKQMDRAQMVAGSGHHSCDGHSHITLELTNAPKTLAMVLNNLHEYNTSEKSARYVEMEDSEDKEQLYRKWLEIFKVKIKERYPEVKYLDDRRITKLAQENARYLNSIFMPATNMFYTTSDRQLNYIYHWFKNEIQNPSQKFYEMLIPSMEDFCRFMNEHGLVDTKLADGKGRGLNLIQDDFLDTYFSDTYQTQFEMSFACLAQAQRHRTINDSISADSLARYFSGTERKFFVPPIIENDEMLKTEWLKDMNLVASRTIPQGAIVNVNETGSYDNFVLRNLERLCTCAQLEIMKQVRGENGKYLQALRQKSASMSQDDPRKQRLSKMISTLEGFEHKNRCRNGYKCNGGCAGFVDPQREI